MQARAQAPAADSVNWAAQALEDLHAGRVLSILEKGREQQFEVVLNEIYIPAEPTHQRWREVKASSTSALLSQPEVREGAAGLVLHPAKLGLPREKEPERMADRRGDETKQRVVLTGKWLLQHRDRAHALAALPVAGFELISEPDYAQGYLIVRAIRGGAESGLRAASALHGHPAIVSSSPLLLRQKRKHFIPEGQAEPNDALFPKQWHLKAAANAKRLGSDIRVLPVWLGAGSNAPLTGEGVRIAIVDDGIDMLHSDLLPNLDTEDNHWDWNDSPPDNDPMAKWQAEDFHGTAVAGLAAARGGNNIGVTGVAPRATLVGFRFLSAMTDDSEDADVMLRGNDVIEIKNNSWGPAPTILDPDFYSELGWSGPLTVAARRTAALTGRGGKGVLSVWASGNERYLGDQGNKDGFSNSIYGIPVGALNANGTVAHFSEGGSHLVCVSPGAAGVVTTDLRASQGYNTGIEPGELTGSLAMRDFTQKFGGTSAAAPILSGMLALMLEANPSLGWRDVKEILLRSSTRIDGSNAGWVSRHGGLYGSMIKHHELYGGGAIDAGQAMSLARTWTNLGPMIEHAREHTAGVVIPDNQSAGVTASFSFSDVADMRVEHVTVKLDIDHRYRGDLHISLTSPSGTVSTLATTTSQDDGLDYKDWIFSSVRHWGESAKGVWQLRCRDLARGDTGVFRSAEVRLFGTQVTPPQLTQAPESVIIPEHGNVTFTAEGTGDGAFWYEWSKGNTQVSAPEGTYGITNMQLAQAGIYRVKIVNATGEESSPDFTVGVLRTAVVGTTVKEGGTAVLRTTAAGPGISLKWFRGETELQDDGRITGSSTGTLTVRRAARDDIGLYRCRARFVGKESPELFTQDASLNVTLRPVLTQAQVLAPAGATAMVGARAELHFVPENGATRYTLRGLPRGMKFDGKTGVLSGVPTGQGPFTLTLTATNAAGTSAPFTFLWPVDPMPEGVAGVFEGVVEADAFFTGGYTGGLGGRLTLNILPSGAYSGSVSLGVKTHRLTGQITTYPGTETPSDSRTQIKFGGKRPNGMTFFSVRDGLLTGTLDDGENGILNFTARRAYWSPALQATHVGDHTAHIALSSVHTPESYLPHLPRGHGHMAGTSNAKGAFRWVGRLPHATTFTSTTLHLQGGHHAWHSLTAARKASVQGWLVQGASTLLTHAAGAEAPVWRFPALPDGLVLDVSGARYAPANHLFDFLTLAEGNDNALAWFSADGSAELFRQNFTLQAPNRITFSRVRSENPNSVSLTVNARKGTFTGALVLPGTPARRGSISGALVRLPEAGSGFGWGYYLLPGGSTGLLRIQSPD